MDIVEAKEITEDLSIGSDELNRMKQQIIKRVGLLSDLVTQVASSCPSVYLTAETPWYLGMWRIIKSEGSHRVVISYYHGSVEPIFDGSQPHAMNHRYIEEMYDLLPYLTLRLVEEFPALEERWASIRSAAKRARKDAAASSFHGLSPDTER